MRRSDLDGRLGTTPPVPGWPTFLLGLLGLPALLFTLITWQVAAHGPLARADERLSRALVHPDRLSGLLADLGSVTVAVPVLTVVLGYVAWRGRSAGLDRWWLPPLAGALLIALVPALIVPLKEIVARPGPSVPGTVTGTGLYPSGHTATATIAYGAATLLLLPWLHTAYARRELVIGALALNALVAIGLVRHGYHWPLDVVASWCLCAPLLTALALFLSRSSRRRSAGTPSPRTGPS